MDSSMFGYLFWGFLIVYAIVMLIVSPKKVSVGGFFRGEDKLGRAVSPGMLTASIFVSWIQAKSVMNCTNLGAEYGIVGGIAYASYWLALPVAGIVMYRLRVKYGAKGIISFLQSNYGKAASIAFSAAILIRLYNEVWSNSSVVGGFYGESGSFMFIAAALFFTTVTLIYSCRGGMRASLVTDTLQFFLFVAVALVVVFMVVPAFPIADYATSSTWTLEGGVDLLLVTLLQLVSYPFHDPIMTDRGFICEARAMLKVYIVSGIIGFIAILGISTIGMYYTLSGYPLSSNVPASLGQIMGGAGYLLMCILMILAAGSTLDSTFASLSKFTAQDAPMLLGRKISGKTAKRLGMSVMILIAIVGNLPMFFGTSVLAATTISGTMVMGLGPIFCLHGMIKPTKIGFHISFWGGLVIGVAFTVFNTAGMWPEILSVGAGKSAGMLGANLYGAIFCWIGYIVPSLVAQAVEKSRGVKPDWKGLPPSQIAYDKEHGTGGFAPTETIYDDSHLVDAETLVNKSTAQV